MNIESKIIEALRAKEWKQKSINLFSGLSKESLNICLVKKIRSYQNSITYLSLAIMFNKPEAVKHLLKAGANIQGITNCGISADTPITFARFIDNEKDFIDMVKLLMVSGASLNSFGINGETLLTYLNRSPLCTNNKIQFLLSKGADPVSTKPYLSKDIHCAKSLLIQGGCSIPENSFSCDPPVIDQLRLLYSGGIRSEIISNISIPEIIKKVERAYGIRENKEKNLQERKEDIISLITNLKSSLKNGTSFKEYIELFRTTQRSEICGLEFKTGNDTTLTGDPINIFSDENLYVSKEDGFLWTYHMSELPNIIYCRKNPYTLKLYSQETLQDMVEKLDFFPYYSDPEEIFDKPPVHVQESQVKFLNFVINSLEPYLNIENALKIRTSLFCEISYLFMGGMYSHILRTCLYSLTSSEGKQFVLGEISKIMILKLRSEQTNLSMVTQCFNQVINDDMMCDKMLETLGIDKDDSDTIYTLFSGVPLEYTENFFDKEKWVEMKKIIMDCGQDFKETYAYFVDKIIRN